MEKELEILLKYCKTLGEDTVREQMYNAYCDGVQGERILGSTIRRLDNYNKSI